MRPYGDEADTIIDKAIADLVEWSRFHGYDPHYDGDVFIDTVIGYVADSMDEPGDYDFAEVLQKAKDDGVFGKLRTRDFDEEFPPEKQNYVIAMSGSGQIGLFYDGSYPYYEGRWRKIDRDAIPPDWFMDYTVFSGWDI